jgi:hypothetical protein
MQLASSSKKYQSFLLVLVVAALTFLGEYIGWGISALVITRRPWYTRVLPLGWEDAIMRTVSVPWRIVL